MSEDFDLSPRASKRRRTTRYGSQRTTLTDQDRPHDLLVNEDTRNGVNDEAEPSSGTGAITPTKHSTVKQRSIKSGTTANARSRDYNAHGSSSEVATTDHGSITPLQTSNRLTTSTNRSRLRSNRSDGKIVNDSSGRIESNHIDADLEKQQEAIQTPKETEDLTPQKRSSGRKRRPTKRLVETLARDDDVLDSLNTVPTVQEIVSEVMHVSPVLKSILTPSRRQKQKVGSRKSVAFNDQDDKEIGEQFGFRDIDTPAVKKLPKISTPHPRKSKTVVDVEEERIEQDSTFANDVHQNDSPEYMPVEEHHLEIPVPALTVERPFSQVTLDNDDSHVHSIRRDVLSRLTSASLPARPPSHLQTQYTQLHTVLSSTVVSSESNSLLLLGPRGSGKTLLLNLALRDLTLHHSNDFHVVRLNGFLQTDDRIALREIWRQLGYSRNLDESETEDIGASYADTMASLLSLLSHPDEMSTEPRSNDNTQETQLTSKSIIFILDEFDLFTTHPRQTLLYNLFDIAQSRKAPIAVIGCSSRMDVIECLEKRVKSRFSHRWFLVPGCKTLVEWETEVKSALCIINSEDELARRTKEEERWTESWNESVENTLLASKEVQNLVKSHFYTTKSLPDLFMSLYPLVATLQVSTSASSITRENPSSSSALPLRKLKQPSVISAVVTLPVLHLSLLISMCRLEAIHSLLTSNFNLVYTHYTELIQTSRLKQTAHGSVTHSGTLRQWGRETCYGAWEELGLWGIIIPAVGGRDEDGGLGVSGAGEAEETRMWRCEVGLEDVLWSVKEKYGSDESGGVASGAGEVLVKWCREV